MSNLLFLLFLFYSIYSPLNSANFVLFTEPKTGTHLLIPILQALTHREVYWAKKYQENTALTPENYQMDLENPEYLFFSIVRFPWHKDLMDEIWNINEKKRTFLHLHAPYSIALENYLTEKKCINFFITRDPRDSLVSLLNHYKYISCDNLILQSISSDDEKLLYMIRKKLRKQTVSYMGWLHSPICCVLEFSKLMGSHGGAASDSDAFDQMKKIAAALNLNISDTALKKIYDNNFGKGWNFFKGKVGSWKDYLNEIHREAIKEEIGDLLIELGYERDYDW